MKSLGIFILFSLLTSAVALTAAEPADNNIKGALYDIEKYEKQFLGLSSANASSVNRSLKLLNLTRQRLDSSTNKSHASWIEADKRYNALVAHMNKLVNGGASAAAPTPSPSSQPDPQRTVSSAPAQASSQPMISQYRVRIKKIQRDIDSVFDTMDKGGVKPFQDPEYVAKFERSAQMHRESIDKYAQWKSDTDVVAAEEALTKLNKMISFGKNHAAKEIAELGDVQAQLRAMDAQMHQLRQPPTPEEPFASGQLNQWLTDLIALRNEAQDAYKPLPAIKERAYLPNNVPTVQEGAPYDTNDLSRIERGLIDLVNSIDGGVNQFTELLQAKMSGLESGLAHYSEYNPADEDDQANHFLGEGRADENRAALAKDLLTANEAASYAKRLNHDTLDSRIALVNKVKATADQYEANYLKARELVRMPKAATTDSKLTKIARDTLASYDYVGNIERLVINTEKVHRSMETSDIEIDDADVSLSGNVTFSGTKTTYFYEWDQFQVATAEPVGDKFYIFYNTLKYYTSGGPTTPLNKWIISGRLQGSEIPKANISK
jgi:hypothetical protein